MTSHQLFLILRARWLLVLSIFSFFVAAAMIFSLITPNQYTGSASIVVDANVDPVAANGGGGGTEALLQSFVTTEVDILSSARVAQRVVRTLRLDQSPELQAKWRDKTDGRGDIVVWLGDYIRTKKLHVVPTRESNVIEISVNWTDAHTAALLANAFAQATIDTNIELKVEPAKQYAGWFAERSRALRADLELKQKRLSDFQNATGIIATDEKLDVENARLAELSTQLVDIQGQRQASQSRQRQTSGDNESLPEVLDSPVIQSLKDNLSQAEARRPDIAARLGKNHPDYQAVESEIATLKDRIAQETLKIAASLGSTTQVDVRRESDIRVALEAQKARVLELKHQHDEAAVLQGDVLSAQRDLDAVTQRFAQSSLESQTKQTNVVQLTSATAPIKASSPNLLVNLALGIFLGGAFAVGAALLREMQDARIRTADDLLQLLQIPVLGKINCMRTARSRARRDKPAPLRHTSDSAERQVENAII
jgi:chain length determinant protein EpsF